MSEPLTSALEEALEWPSGTSCARRFVVPRASGAGEHRHRPASFSASRLLPFGSESFGDSYPRESWRGRVYLDINDLDLAIKNGRYDARPLHV